jgi:aspartate/methionine/tyrosine aminotransferase
MQQSTDAKPSMSRDWAICRWLTLRKGVAAIPPSSFFCTEHSAMAKDLMRLAFCKEDAVIAVAAEKLGATASL